MTFTTTNGIRYPNDPNAYADIIKFFEEMATDIDTKFVSNKAASAVMQGTLTAKTLISSNGGLSQSSTVLQTGTKGGDFAIFDDDKKIDGSPGRRLWVNGSNGTDVGIGAKASGEKLNRISMTATTLDLNGAVTINGTLNVTGLKTSMWRDESDVWLLKGKTAWTEMAAVPGFTFTTPPSAAVTLGFGAMLPAESTTCQLTYEVREGPTLKIGTVILPRNPAGAAWAPPTGQPPPQSVTLNSVGGTGVQWSSVYTPFLLTGSPTAGAFQVAALKPNTVYNVVPYYLNRNTVDLKMYRIYCLITPDL